MNKIPFPVAIDSSMRSSFVSCPRQFYWAHMRHQVPINPSVHLHAGGAFAKGLEVARIGYYFGGLSAKEAVGRGAVALTLAYGDFVPTDPYSGKTWDGMLGAYDAYFNQFPLETDPLRPVNTGANTGAVEFSFAIPIPGTKHPQTGDPILYTGRFDMLGEMDKQIFVVDEKTTSRLGASWAKQWDLRAQFTGYIWACHEYGYAAKGALIRGVSILKTGYGTAQAITYRPEWKIHAWMYSLRQDIDRMIRIWEETDATYSWWPQSLDSACTSYGECAYTTLCNSPTPDEWVPVHYREHVWSPVQLEQDSTNAEKVTA